MSRAKIEQVKGYAFALFGVCTFILIFIGGGPSAYGAAFLMLPIILLALSGYFFWKSSVFDNED